jgi:hypothetical protein
MIAQDDAQALASGCVALHEDAGAWQAMRSSATARLRVEFGRDQFRENLDAALNGLPPPLHAASIPHQVPRSADAVP